MDKKLKIFMKHCSYCETDFGCVVDGEEKKCATCTIDYGSKKCSVHFTNTISHGICKMECFYSFLSKTDPITTQQLREFTTK